MLLAIDTSTRYAGVAIADDERVLSARNWYSTSSHTADLLPAVFDLLNRHNLKPQGLDGIAVALGPGGFSSLRVGVSVAKGLATPSNSPLVGLGTLSLEAWPYLESGLPVCALLDSGRREVASAHFGTGGQRTRGDLICPPEELLSEIEQRTLFCGEGLLTWAPAIREQLGTLAVVPHYSPVARLWSLVELARKRLAEGDSDDLASLQPYYMRMPSIGGPKRRDQVPQRS